MQGVDKNLLYAALMILIIAVLSDVYPPLGWGLFFLALMAMVAIYYKPDFFEPLGYTFTETVIPPGVR